MKKVFIQLLQPDPEGPTFARMIATADQMAIQEFAHDHVTRVVKDMLVAGAEAAQVAGFAATLTEGLGVSIAAGNAIDENGVHYQLDAAVEKILGAADPANPRIDIIYGTLSVDAEAELELAPFRRRRTTAEIEAGLDPYPPTQYTVPTEKHTKLTVNVRAGVPAADPEAPALNDGEVPLWHVSVDAGETDLAGGDLTDVRVLMKSLYQVLQDVIALQNLVTQSGIREMVEDIVGAFASSPDGSLTVVYNDAGNAFTIVLATAYKSLLDGATSAATVSTLMKRDASGDAAVRDIKPTRQVLFGDSSLHRAAFPRESSYSFIDENTPVSFHGTVVEVYETLKRTGVQNYTNGGAEPLVTVAPDFAVWLDPADFVGVSLKLEAYLQHTGFLGATSVQIYNETDATELASVDATWLHTTGGPFRSAVVNLSGSGFKKLVLRARHRTNLDATSLGKIWRVRLIVNPSF